MMNKYIVLLLLMILFNYTSVQARKRHWIPGPVITTAGLMQISPGTILTLSGQGFIKGLPSAHQVWLLNGSKRIQVSVLSATADALEIQIPGDIEFGDYDIWVRIQTRLLYSDKALAPRSLLLRPPAPLGPRLNYEAISDTREFDQMLMDASFQGHELHYELSDELQRGLNELKAYYIQDGYQSIRSIAAKFYYLPALEFEKQLEVESESPLKSFAVTKSASLEDGLQLNYDVSSITKKEIEDLSKRFYLRTPLQPRYLERTIKLKPVFVEAIHVLEPEYAVLRNRSGDDISLSKCSLSDSLKEYVKFTNEKVLAHNSITINKNLGLNNTTPDSLIFTCNGEVLDQFDYDKVDAAGLGIRL